jgi:AcrR family transcriptional regulator
MSHGVFYRYFKNKNEFIRPLVLQAVRPLATVLASLQAVHPDAPTCAADLRTWLRQYNATQLAQAGLISVWAEAIVHDPLLGAAAAPALDQGRRRLAEFLSRRDLGNRQLEAVVMLAALEAFGDRRRTPTALEAAAQLIERGLLGK